MSRVKIGVVVAVVVAALTATAYFLTTSSLEKRIRADVKAQVSRSRDLWIQNATMHGLDIIQRGQLFASYQGFSEALQSEEVKEQETASSAAIRRFLDERKLAEPPTFIAVVNAQGRLVAYDPGGVIGQDTDWKPRVAVAKALEAREGKAFKDIWDENGIVQVAVAPLLSFSTGQVQVRGAVIAGWPLDAADAKDEARRLGGHVAFFMNDKIVATSAGRAGGPEDRAISKVLFEKGLAKAALEKGVSDVQEVTVGWQTYLVSAAKMPFNVSDPPAGAAVLVSLDEALAPVGSIRMTILLLGLGALVIAILAILVTARLILNPAEEIELGVNEIINGNIDYTFRPVGADFDGLANGLNVMLARLLGRPEPGEEEYDDEGNVVGASSKVLLDEGAAALGGMTAASDPETLALAAEPEADYYRRIFNEYTAARKAAGEKTDGITYEGFVAKLRLNEGNLKKKYNCRAVRFKVHTKDGQVTLKPVPIV